MGSILSQVPPKSNDESAPIKTAQASHEGELVGDLHTTVHGLNVMYHYVHDEANSDTAGIPGLSATQFREQIDLLYRLAEPIDWLRLYGFLEGTNSLPEKCFLLTFDDGLAEHAQVVVPILEEYGLRGLFFVSGQTIEHNLMLPAHMVHLLLARLEDERFEQELLTLLEQHGPMAEFIDRLNSDSVHSLYHYESPARAKIKYLLNVIIPMDIRNAVVQELFEKHVGDSSDWARRWYLNKNDLRSLQSKGHSIGGHGDSHEPLTRLSKSQLETDLKRTADILKKSTGNQPMSISYPFGRFDDETTAACKKAGFVAGFTTKETWMETGVSLDTMRLPRIDTIHVDRFLK